MGIRASLAGVPSKYPYPSAVGAVLAAVAVLELVGPSVNAANAAQILLLVILLDARFCGTRPALLASVFAAAGFVRYFVTPRGLAFGDPNDIAALAAFIIMAAVGGELASRAERRAKEAEELYLQLQAAFERESEAEATRRNERLKATLLDAMAHNLRTPLTSIKAAVTAMAGAIRGTENALTPEEQRELLDVIDEESDRLNRFIGGLASSDGSAHPHPSTVRAVDVKEIADAALLRADALTRDHHIVRNIDDKLPAVCVDAASMIEVMYMLIDNASKYSPPDTTIRVTAARHGATHVSVRVVDEGPGIPVEFRERAFDRFFRIPGRESHDTTRTGAGVGLALARRLVETQGGRIWIETPEHRQGTAVVIIFPVLTP